jgi:hypothetical protein
LTRSIFRTGFLFLYDVYYLPYSFTVFETPEIDVILSFAGKQNKVQSN